MPPFLIASLVACAAGVLLLLHHGWIHAHDDPNTSLAHMESCPGVCYFQPSDVCNFETHNHENWIVLFFVLALIFLGIHIVLL